MSKYLKEANVRQTIIDLNQYGITQVAPDVYEALDQTVEKILRLACHTARRSKRKKLRAEDVDMLIEDPSPDYEEQPQEPQE